MIFTFTIAHLCLCDLLWLRHDIPEGRGPAGMGPHLCSYRAPRLVLLDEPRRLVHECLLICGRHRVDMDDMHPDEEGVSTLGRGHLHRPEEDGRDCLCLQPRDEPRHPASPASHYLEASDAEEAKAGDQTRLFCGHDVSRLAQPFYPFPLTVLLTCSSTRSACVCAAGGVYENFRLDYHNDASYYSPLAELWVIGEGTCILLVFCIPTAPKVFRTDDHLMARIARSLCRWASFPSTWPSGSQTSLHHPNAKPGHSTNEPLAELDQYGSKPNVGAKHHGVVHIVAP